MSKESITNKQASIALAHRELIDFRNSQSVNVKKLLKQMTIGYNELSEDFCIVKERVISAIDRVLAEEGK